MVFAGLRPVGLGHDHAQEIVRLRILGGDAHTIAGVDFSFGDGALGEQRQGQLVRRPQCIGVELHEAPQQRLGGQAAAVGAADPPQGRERLGLRWRQLQYLVAQPLGLGGSAVALCGDRLLGHRQQRRPRSGGRQYRRVEPATPHGPQPAAAPA